ncbi:hypothetical protein SDC9_207760 [bioreactor metagenome]|uniref:Uncharacterized protein n=1 Tax=bioreactor metagenome TaxID=1076179 RepID=A0A645J9G3_9ZZZZ
MPVFLQIKLHFPVLGKHNDSGSFSVDPVNDIDAIRSGTFLNMIFQNRESGCFFFVAGSYGKQTFFLFYDNYILIFVDYTKFGMC